MLIDTSTPTTKREQAELAMRHSWFAVARSADVVDAPVPATLLGQRLVVWRGRGGAPRVTAARCPHRGGDLAMGKVHGDDIGCPYHGWRWSGETGGCTLVPSLANQRQIPPRAAIKAYPAIERFGHVWTVLEDPIADLYDPEEWHPLDLEWLAADPIDSPTGVAVAIENFRDVAHFPFVHEVSMGPTPPVVERLEVRRDGLDIYMDRSLNAGTGDWGDQGDCMMRYHCTAPGFAGITYVYEKLGTRIVVGFPSPISYEHVKIFWGVANERTFRGDSIQECLRIEEMVYLEDVPIVERLEPREVPWDREFEEFSVPADLFTMNYRRAFGELMERVSAPEPVAVEA
jgi:phenylpropionate dioxygenase-like ring-hydroxylating dioxygenase large terminal subunit